MPNLIHSNQLLYPLSGSFSGSLEGTSSWAVSASQAVSASWAPPSPIAGGKATHIPYFITDTTFSTSSLYQSGSDTVIINQDNATSANPEALYVWQPSQTSFNVISGKGNLNNYLQLNIQNNNQGTNASSDVVATAGNGNENGNYIDMGINSDNFSGFLGGPNDAYLYATGSHLHIGNATPNKPLQFFVGGPDTDTNRKFELNSNNQHNLTGSLEISSKLVVNQGITGSLQGTATNATNASTASYVAGGNVVGTVLSASHADQADNAINATYAATAGNGGVTNIVAGSGVTLIPTSGVGAVTVIATGTGGVTIISGSVVTASFSTSNTWNFAHNLGTRTPIITVFDSNYNQIIPENILLVDTGSATITFPTLESGFAIASTGGSSGTAISSSYALLATYATTASYYAETDPVYIAQKPTLATTGSNTFRGNQTITGSLTVSGSGTFTNIGPAIFTGSVSITGSTTQTGNNTLIGNTVLSGSINISGSTTLNGTTSFYGTHILSGSNTITGNTIMSGSIEVSGSSNFRNSIFIVTGSAHFKGLHNVSGSTSITGSLNVLGDINVVSGSSFTRWGNKLFNYGAFSSTQTQTGPRNTTLSASFNTTDVGGSGVSLVDNTKITVDNTGIYNLQFSAQLDRTTTGTNIVTIWFAYTGSNIANSATDITITGGSGTNPIVASWNYVLPMSASSYIEIYWSHDDNQDDKVEIKAVGTRSGPVRPAVPSIIATLTQIA